MKRPIPQAVRGLGSALILSIAAAGIPAAAATVFSANITHDQETAPNGTAPLTTVAGDPQPMSFGTATLVLNDAETELSMFATIYNIDVTGTQTPDANDDLVAAHIHAPAAPGTNGGVRWGFFGAPDNDNAPDNLIFTPFANGVGGTFSSVWNEAEGNNTTLTAQLDNIKGGLSYLNFHTRQFGGGEIRGQILAIPEPGSMALLASALLPVAGAFARRKRTSA